MTIGQHLDSQSGPMPACRLLVLRGFAFFVPYEAKEAHIGSIDKVSLLTYQESIRAMISAFSLASGREDDGQPKALRDSQWV